jgi:ribosomal protein S18 acetylase RimI-like enzyme
VIRPFEAADVAAAADLLVRRHAAHLVTQPLLAPLVPEQAVTAVQAAFDADGRTGWVAQDAGAVVGYLLAAPADPRWFPGSAWVGDAGCAGEFLPELYAAAAAAWLADGLRGHYLLVPPALVDTFFPLGFGLQHVHAAMPAAGLARDPRVRRAVRSDVPALAELDLVLDATLGASPVFSTVPDVTLQEAVQEWEEGIDDASLATYVAEVGGRVVGSAIGLDVTGSRMTAGLLRPSRAGFLGFAAVLPEARGQGLGRALGDAVTSWAAAQGFPAVCSDWRSANLTAARTWPRLGYTPTFLRLHRHVA